MSNRSIGFVARLAVALTATGAMTVSVEAQRHFGGGGLRGGGLQGRANFHAPGSA